MKIANLFLSLVGKEKVECPRCHGEGVNGRGDWCWCCRGTGFQVIPRKETPFS